MTWGWKQKVPPTQKFILIALCDHANDEDFTCWPSLRHLERKTGFNRTTIWRTIDQLIAAGGLDRVGTHPSGSTIYKVMVGNVIQKLGEQLPLGADSTYVQPAPRVGAENNRVGAHSNKVGAQDTLNHQEPSRTISNRSTAANAAKRDEYPEDFEQAFGDYPKREGDNPKKQAFQAWNARSKEGHGSEELRQGVGRYKAYLQARGEIGTTYVMQAKRFFGPDKPFLNPWEVKTKPNGNGKTFEELREELRPKRSTTAGESREPRAIESTATRTR